jgi:hypothetical protein
MPEQEQPLEPILQEIMNDIGHIIADVLKKTTAGSEHKYGFCLMMFGLTGGESMRMNYIANVVREDMIAAMKEFIARQEGRYFDQRETVLDFAKKNKKKDS